MQRHVLVIALLTPFLMTGCHPGPKTVKTSDGRFQLTVPGVWITKERPNHSATLYACTRAGNIGVAVGSDPIEKAEPTLEAFVQGNREGLIADGDTADATALTQVNINGYKALRYEITRNKYEIRCLMTGVSTPGYYSMLAACADLPQYAANAATLQQISETFRPVE